jgi:hypothetical protein
LGHQTPINVTASTEIADLRFSLFVHSCGISSAFILARRVGTGEARAKLERAAADESADAQQANVQRTVTTKLRSEVPPGNPAITCFFR